MTERYILFLDVELQQRHRNIGAMSIRAVSIGAVCIGAVTIRVGRRRDDGVSCRCRDEGPVNVKEKRRKEPKYFEGVRQT